MRQLGSEAQGGDSGFVPALQHKQTPVLPGHVPTGVRGRPLGGLWGEGRGGETSWDARVGWWPWLANLARIAWIGQPGSAAEVWYPLSGVNA